MTAMIDWIIAQVPEINWQAAVFAYGPLGVMCAWLMLRSERKFDELGEKIIAELKVLGHRMNGMTRAMLADVASRETTGTALKTLVHDELRKLESEEEVRAFRERKH
jgi:hypothetical protein